MLPNVPEALIVCYDHFLDLLEPLLVPEKVDFAATVSQDELWAPCKCFPILPEAPRKANLKTLISLHLYAKMLWG